MDAASPVPLVIYQYKAANDQPIVDARAVAAMNDMLATAITKGTGRNAAIGRKAALGRHPVAGKNGTSQGFRDAWFIGYSAQMTAGVWVGNDNGRAMKRVTGGTLPARIWRQLMIAAHKGLSPRSLPGLATNPRRPSRLAKR